MSLASMATEAEQIMQELAAVRAGSRREKALLARLESLGTTSECEAGHAASAMTTQKSAPPRKGAKKASSKAPAKARATAAVDAAPQAKGAETDGPAAGKEGPAGRKRRRRDAKRSVEEDPRVDGPKGRSQPVPGASRGAPNQAGSAADASRAGRARGSQPPAPSRRDRENGMSGARGRDRGRTVMHGSASEAKVAAAAMLSSPSGVGTSPLGSPDTSTPTPERSSVEVGHEAVLARLQKCELLRKQRETKAFFSFNEQPSSAQGPLSLMANGRDKGPIELGSFVFLESSQEFAMAAERHMNFQTKVLLEDPHAERDPGWWGIR